MAFPFAAAAGVLGGLGSLFGANKTGRATEKAASQNRALLTDLQTKGLGYIDSGKAEAQGYLNQAGDLWDPIAALGGKGAGLYADALGLNGAGGSANAQSAFTTSPGYDFQMDQGLQALERRAAAQGRLQSGATGIDTMKYSQGLANQEWGNWLDRLSGYNNMWTAGVGGQSGSLSDLASLASGAAGQKIDLTGSIASALMGANNQTAAGKEARNASLMNSLSGISNSIGKFAGGYR